MEFLLEFLVLMVLCITLHRFIKDSFTDTQYIKEIIITETEDICKINGYRRRKIPAKIYNMFPVNNELDLLKIRLTV